MNIKEAKEQIKNAMTAYFTKNKFGNYVIPVEKQRPVFLMGPPGIGKTAIMEQIAQELGVGLISYSMTHHTRQSALGLPFIVKKNYEGEEYDISEYTMSEIIAAVYDMKEKSGKKEGILFLDEINCVSETLSPAMLQFLQYKVFGRHKVPDGWIVVTAGNPPEFNNSVREFDIVTWDRLKRVDVDPDYDVWKEYAYKSGVHASITTYLDVKKGDFYKIENTVDGKSFVTARGWSDLSDMIKLYEQHGIKVDEKLIAQYLQNPKIAKNFAVYYDLFNKYKSDYQIDQILAGKVTEDIVCRAKEARFDERLSLLGLIIDGITEKLRDVTYMEKSVMQLLNMLKGVRAGLAGADADAITVAEAELEKARNAMTANKKAGALSSDDEYAAMNAILMLEQGIISLKEKNIHEAAEGFAVLKADYDIHVAELKSLVAAAKSMLSNAFKFAEDVFEDGQEMLILVTELTIGYYCAHFISRYGCDEYYRHNKELLFYERQKELISEIESLELE